MRIRDLNPDNPLVAFIYGITALFAIVIHALIAVALEKLTWLLSSRQRSPVTSITETATSENLTLP